MVPRLQSGPGSIPVDEIAAMYRLRNFLVARQVVETVDEMWNLLTQDEWAWIRRGRDAGGYGIETPDAAQVVFGEAALTGAVGIAARSLGDPGDLSPTTVRYVCVVLRIALGRALKTAKVMRNVAALVDLPRRARFENRPLSGDQVRAFLASVRGRRFETIYVLAIATGMRQGELLALRWADVDLDSGAVTVRNTLQFRTRELAEPKTDNARRTLRIG
jgi:integrase